MHALRVLWWCPGHIISYCYVPCLSVQTGTLTIVWRFMSMFECPWFHIQEIRKRTWCWNCVQPD